MKGYNGFTGEQRIEAQKWLNQQWDAGLLPKPTQCHACGQTKGRIDAHAEDYSIPYAAGKTDQYHLCFRCHMMVHCRFRNKAAWKLYIDCIASGIIYSATSSYTRLCYEHFDGGKPVIQSVSLPHNNNILNVLKT